MYGTPGPFSAPPTVSGTSSSLPFPGPVLCMGPPAPSPAPPGHIQCMGPPPQLCQVMYNVWDPLPPSQFCWAIDSAWDPSPALPSHIQCLGPSAPSPTPPALHQVVYSIGLHSFVQWFQPAA
ncbi:unnamed protein product [Natator depressus]